MLISMPTPSLQPFSNALVRNMHSETLAAKCVHFLELHA